MQTANRPPDGPDFGPPDGDWGTIKGTAYFDKPVGGKLRALKYKGKLYKPQQDAAFRVFTWVLCLTAAALVLAWASLLATAPRWLMVGAMSVAGVGYVVGITLILMEVRRWR